MLPSYKALYINAKAILKMRKQYKSIKVFKIYYYFLFNFLFIYLVSKKSVYKSPVQLVPW